MTPSPAPVRPRRRPLRLRTSVLAAVALSLMAVGLSSCQPPTIAVSTVVTGLARPWDIAFLPDGTMLYTERAGRIDALVGGATQVLAAPSDVYVRSEAGMMGLAVDPDFESNRRIYACMASRSGPPEVNGGLDVRVVRWRVAEDLSGLTDRTDIVTGMPINPALQPGRHAGCRPRFGPDGYLWVGTGDAAWPTYPQDPTSLGGKVLRVDTDGNGAPDNPGGALDPRIYTYGHRNVQGIAFRHDGLAISVEHGTSCDDEINVLVPGGNYGWDPVNPRIPDQYTESRPMTDLVKFPDAEVALWSSGCPTIAPSGAVFLSGPQWDFWNSGLAVAVLKDTHLRIQRWSLDLTWMEEYIEITDQGRLRSAVQGPDGNLYLATDANPGSILKVVPTPVTEPG